MVFAGQEVGVGQFQRGCHHAAHVRYGALAEQYAVGIDQEDLAVGVEVAVYRRRIGAQHPVQRDGVAVGLDEVDGFLRVDVEALPVDGEFRAGLVYRQRGAGRTDAAGTGANMAVRGQGQAFGPNASNSETARPAWPAVTDDDRLPPFLAISEAATKVPVFSFQIEQ